MLRRVVACVVAAAATAAACPFATVVHVHQWTAAVSDRLRRARDSLGARGCRLIVVTTGFAATIEGVETVDGTETAELQRRYPSLSGSLHRKAFAGWKGDRGVLLAYAHAEARKPPLERFFWNVEADVEWKGDLYEILDDWSDRSEDLLCIDLRRSTYDWPHLQSHDKGDWLLDVDKHNCLMTIARASGALLREVLDVATRPGHLAYLELRFASECARRRRTFANCTMRELFDSDDRIERRRGDMFTWTGSRRHRRFNRPSRFAEIFAKAKNGTLWHPVKDPGAWAVDVAAAPPK